MKITPENILCIVPARSGSKGIKNKNIKKLAGIPLINYTLETASKTFPKENIIISSDSKEIIKMGEPFEIKTPFLRPKKIASDYSKTIFTVLKNINRLENNYEDSMHRLNEFY
jgi:CMP-N-acetylneuraminic acid synthetase